MNGRDTIGVLRSEMAQRSCKLKTTSTTYLVQGSGPQSLVTFELSAQQQQAGGSQVRTSGWALMIACRLVLWGSSVYDQKKRSAPTLVGCSLGESDLGADDNVVVRLVEYILLNFSKSMLDSPHHMRAITQKLAPKWIQGMMDRPWNRGFAARIGRYIGQARTTWLGAASVLDRRG